jgi:hypothetical protein
MYRTSAPTAAATPSAQVFMSSGAVSRTRALTRSRVLKAAAASAMLASETPFFPI